VAVLPPTVLFKLVRGEIPWLLHTFNCCCRSFSSDRLARPPQGHRRIHRLTPVSQNSTA